MIAVNLAYDGEVFRKSLKVKNEKKKEVKLKWVGLAFWDFGFDYGSWC